MKLKVSKEILSECKIIVLEISENVFMKIFRLGNVGGRGVLRRNYTGKKPVVIQHRTPDAANYYDHENVSFNWDHLTQ